MPSAISRRPNKKHRANTEWFGSLGVMRQTWPNGMAVVKSKGQSRGLKIEDGKFQMADRKRPSAVAQEICAAWRNFYGNWDLQQLALIGGQPEGWTTNGITGRRRRLRFR